MRKKLLELEAVLVRDHRTLPQPKRGKERWGEVLHLPLAALLRKLGIQTSTTGSPFGGADERTRVLQDLKELARGGGWRIHIIDLTNEPNPLGECSGEWGDPIWVGYSPALPSQKYPAEGLTSVNLPV